MKPGGSGTWQLGEAARYSPELLFPGVSEDGLTEPTQGGGGTAATWRLPPAVAALPSCLIRGRPQLLLPPWPLRQRLRLLG